MLKDFNFRLFFIVINAFLVYFSLGIHIYGILSSFKT